VNGHQPGTELDEFSVPKSSAEVAVTHEMFEDGNISPENNTTAMNCDYFINLTFVIFILEICRDPPCYQRGCYIRTMVTSVQLKKKKYWSRV
jgi:hypothetical protein